MNKSPDIEKEIKIKLLSEKDYHNVRAVLIDPVKTVIQINYYFDTPGHWLRNNFTMLRLRQERDKNVLTLKQGLSLENGYFQAEEREEAVSEEDARKILAQPSLLRRFYSAHISPDSIFDNLTLLGSIRTTRSKHKFGDHLLELDAVEYPNQNKDFEIEIETMNVDAVRPSLINFLDSHQIKYEFQTHTKYERFLNNLK